jgi:hypothetical protein
MIQAVIGHDDPRLKREDGRLQPGFTHKDPGQAMAVFLVGTIKPTISIRGIMKKNPSYFLRLKNPC